MTVRHQYLYLQSGCQARANAEGPGRTVVIFLLFDQDKLAATRPVGDGVHVAEVLASRPDQLQNQPLGSGAPGRINDDLGAFPANTSVDTCLFAFFSFLYFWTRGRNHHRFPAHFVASWNAKVSGMFMLKRKEEEFNRDDGRFFFYRIIYPSS